MGLYCFHLPLSESQSVKNVSCFGNELQLFPITQESSKHFHCTYMGDQFLSTSLFFLNSCLICLMLEMASVPYIISILSWHHQLPLMTLGTVSFLSPPSLQLQDPDVRFRNAFFSHRRIWLFSSVPKLVAIVELPAK